MKAEAGRLGGKAKAEAYQTASSGLVDAIAESSPPSSSSSPSPSPSPSASPIPVTNNNLVTTAVVVTKGNGNGNGHNARSKHPIFSGQRFVVFDWMLEDIGRTLGNHLDAFDVHEWFFSLDARAVKDSIVKPKNDWWPWIQAELLAEAEKRGLPTAEPKKFGVTTKTAGNAAALKRFAERKSS